MNRLIKPIILSLALLAIFLPGNAAAENKSGALGVTLFYGGYTFDPDQDLDAARTYGLVLGYNATAHWGIEGQFNYVDTEDNGDEDVAAYVYHLDALYHFIPENRLVPYVALGAGGINYDYDRPGVSNDAYFLANYGAGLKYFLGESVALRADVRHIISFNDTNNNLLYTLGLLFSFGGEKKKVDSDGDGVFDEFDKCPDTPRGVAVDSSGCPLDSDGDGVPDYLDKCPDTPSGAAVDADGCPKDSDGDGVPDYLDKCPDTPRGLVVDENGCPKAEPKGAEVTERGAYIFRNIQFDFGKATLKGSAYPAMDEVMAFLESNPDLKLEIRGHTDNVGPKDFNQMLSEKRAGAVMDYLVGKGVDPGRLSAQGYGMSDPMTSNDTSQGRALNRRVEFVPVP